MIRPLGRADTAEALELLRARPIQNVYLEHLVRLGALGAMPGFLGYFAHARLAGVMLVASNGGVALDVRDAAGTAELAAAARVSLIAPRHIVGAEEVTVPFWNAYAWPGLVPLWTRREPVYVVGRAERKASGLHADAAFVERARERDLDTVVAQSARQYVEDLKVDRHAADPGGFRERHASELRDGRWWVARERGRVVFQAHVGPENDQVVQIGGVFSAPDVRGRGVASRGVAALADLLLLRLPGVSLFCDEANAAARRVYERVGFRVAFHYRSYLVS
jgi:hypothetical protein